MNQSSIPLQSFDISEEGESIQACLAAKIKAEIVEQGGKIPFSKFMQMALYQPELGYYQNNLHKFGDKGDFITAPEMGNNFAKCLANSLVDYILSNKDELNLMEIGAGSGILAANLLDELGHLGGLPSQYLILEPSAELQAQQKSLLLQRHSEYFKNIIWISELPENFSGIILANEVVDAIPCERIVRVDEQWRRLGVGCNNDTFVDCLMDDIDIADLPEGLKTNGNSNDYPEGYATEYCPLTKGWINALSNSLKQGAIILFDYGYAESELYHPQRLAGSLTCFINHHSHSDPYQYVGLQDITAHVDFTQIARNAHEFSLDVGGYTTQAGFLLENGITEISEKLAENESQEQRYKRSQELQKLLMPGQMGEVIKVILLGKNLETEIKGFSLQDHLYRL